MVMKMQIKFKAIHLHVNDKHIELTDVTEKVTYYLDMTKPWFMHGIADGSHIMMEFTATSGVTVRTVCDAKSLSIMCPYFGEQKNEGIKQQTD